MLCAPTHVEGRTANTPSSTTATPRAHVPPPRDHAQTGTPQIGAVGDLVTIRDVQVHSAALASGIRAHPSTPEALTYLTTCLDVGAQALAGARRDHDTVALRTALDDAERRVSDAARRAADTVTQTVLQVIDAQDGGLARGVNDQVERLKTDLDRLVAHENSPVRLATDRFLARAAEELKRASEADSTRLRQALSLDHPDSALARLRTEFHAAAEQSRRDVNAALTEVRTLLAVEQATQQVTEQGAAKGLTYEQEVCTIVEQITHGLGDLFEATGNQRGLIADCKTGDAVTTVAERTAPGRVVKLVIEAKDATLSAARWSTELDKARNNRGAGAALGIVNGREHMPGGRSIHVLDPLRMLVCHERGAAPDVVLAAYHLLRVQAVQATVGDARLGTDVAALQRQVDDTLAALEGFDALDRAVSQSAKASATAAAASERLRRTLASHVSRLSELLRADIAAFPTAPLATPADPSAAS